MWYSETIGTIKTPRALTVDGIQHPANIFTAWSKQELSGIGFYPARVESVDSRYYDTGSETYELVDGEYVISYATTEKDVELLKEDLIKKVQANTGALLAPSDWRVIRSIDSENAMSSEWTTYRNEVRAYGNSLESGIEAFASVDAVRNFQNHEVQEERRVENSDETETVNRTVDKTYWGWPESPDAEADPLHVRYI
jgi:hypothetical protein